MSPSNTIISTAGLLVAGIALLVALDARTAQPSAPADSPACPDIASVVEDLDRELWSLREETQRLRSELSGQLEARAEDAAAPESTGPEVTENATDRESRSAELLALGRRILAGKATPDETSRFYRLVRADDLLEDVLAGLEAEVAADPADVAARLRLAEAYILKLFTVPLGPEMGIWSGKAEAQWCEILRVEPDHWKARFSLAVSLSYHPDALSTTPEVIRHLEHLVRQQESMTPEPPQADTYRLLATMHLRRGDRELAAQVLRRGRERHPRDAKIQKALQEYDR